MFTNVSHPLVITIADGFIEQLERALILEQYFPIIGVNGRSLGIEEIKNDDIYGTVTDDPASQADAMYQLAMRLLNNQSLSDFPYAFDRGKFIRTKGEILRCI